ncbi:hypothetical protein [Thalassoglobus neptunius]|nr:hypothetical protein [Thalassoglobus neptunius]
MFEHLNESGHVSSGRIYETTAQPVASHIETEPVQTGPKATD